VAASRAVSETERPQPPAPVPEAASSSGSRDPRPAGQLRRPADLRRDRLPGIARGSTGRTARGATRAHDIGGGDQRALRQRDRPVTHAGRPSSCARSGPSPRTSGCRPSVAKHRPGAPGSFAREAADRHERRADAGVGRSAPTLRVDPRVDHDRLPAHPGTFSSSSRLG
jgi:hypothetical protein